MSKFFNISICLLFLLPPCALVHDMFPLTGSVDDIKEKQRQRDFLPFSVHRCVIEKKNSTMMKIFLFCKLDIQIMIALVWIFLAWFMELNFEWKKSPLLVAVYLKLWANLAALTFFSSVVIKSIKSFQLDLSQSEKKIFRIQMTFGRQSIRSSSWQRGSPSQVRRRFVSTLWLHPFMISIQIEQWMNANKNTTDFNDEIWKKYETAWPSDQWHRNQIMTSLCQTWWCRVWVRVVNWDIF